MLCENIPPVKGGPTFARALSLVVVIPALADGPGLRATLDQLRGDVALIVVVLPQDAPVPSAPPAGVAFFAAPQGRGCQLAAGGAVALALGAEWILFLHSDSLLGAGWRQAVSEHCLHQGERRVGYFLLGFAGAVGQSRPARRVAALANWRARRWALPYGDQGLLISRRLYQDSGGYAEIPLMEDVDLVRRLRRRFGRGVLVPLAGVCQTDPVRYQRGGWWGRPLRNLGCLAAYSLGVSPERIVAWYRR